MIIVTALITILLISAGSYYLGTGKMRICAASARTASLPLYYGWCTVIWCFVSGIVALIIGQHLPFNSPILVSGIVTLVIAIISLFFISPRFKAQRHLEKLGNFVLFLSAVISISITILIVLSVLFESLRFFKLVPLHDFLFGLNWSPQTALRADQAGSSGSFGAIPVFAGTLLITCIAMTVSIPLGLMAAIYLSEYATPRLRMITKPLLEMLAGIPTVVYGYFAALTIAPYIRQTGTLLGMNVASESALAAGLVMGIMIIPFILSLSDDVMNAVPNNLREASLALGATRAETITKVVVPAALPGIMGAVLLAISRAIGETMIVTMAAGLAANLTFNPFASVTTVTAQIVTLLVGDQEFDSAKTLAAFALGLVLFYHHIVA